MKILVPPTLNLATAASLPDLGPIPESLQAPVGEARHLLFAYARKFAAQPRATRDVALLHEMAARLRGLHAEILDGSTGGAGVERVVVAITSHLALFAVEIPLLDKAARDGPPKARLRWLTDRLNGQLELYRVHCAGRARLSRRPGLLQRSIDSVTGILAALEDPQIAALEDARIALCKERGQAQLATLRDELAQVQRVHAESSPAARFQSLKAEVDLVQAEFRACLQGKPRQSASLDHLGYLCDRLLEVEVQLGAMARQDRGGESAQYLSKLQRLQDAYETEHQTIRNIQRRQVGRA